jgi:hypothetical protein
MAHLQTDGAQALSVWHNGGMTGYHERKRAKRPRDFSQAAKLVDIASGQAEDRLPTPEEEGKDPAAVSLGRRGGLKGGKVRAEKLSPEHRAAIARKAAASRWRK